MTSAGDNDSRRTLGIPHCGGWQPRPSSGSAVPTSAANPFFTLDIHGLGWQALLHPIVAILMLAPLVVSTGPATPLPAALSWRPIAWIGTVSYGAYLWHTRVLDLQIVQATIRHTGPGHGLPAILGGTVLAFALTLFAGAASWYAVERPVMRLGRRRARRHAHR